MVKMDKDSSWGKIRSWYPCMASVFAASTWPALYDLKFNITDKNGKVLFEGKRTLTGGTYTFAGVPQSVMKVIDSGEASIAPVGIWLQYGKVPTPYDKTSRDWLKGLPEVALDVKTVRFSLPGASYSDKNGYRKIVQEREAKARELARQKTAEEKALAEQKAAEERALAEQKAAEERSLALQKAEEEQRNHDAQIKSGFKEQLFL